MASNGCHDYSDHFLFFGGKCTLTATKSYTQLCLVLQELYIITFLFSFYRDGHLADIGKYS